MATGLERNKPLNRPKKSEARKRQRRKLHIKRLEKLGVPADKAAKLDSKQIRAMIRKPKKTAKAFAKKS